MTAVFKTTINYVIISKYLHCIDLHVHVSCTTVSIASLCIWSFCNLDVAKTELNKKTLCFWKSCYCENHSLTRKALLHRQHHQTATDRQTPVEYTWHIKAREIVNAVLKKRLCTQSHILSRQRRLKELFSLFYYCCY